MARNVGAAALPVVGPEKIVLAVWVARVPVNVPEEVIGEPETVIIDGRERATLDTVPATEFARVPLEKVRPVPTVIGVQVLAALR